MADTELTRHLLALLELKGVGPSAVKKNIGRIQSSLTATDVFEAVAAIIGDKANKDDWQSALTKSDQHLYRCGQVGIDAISIVDPRYPPSLLELSTPPPVLFCRGNLSLLSRPMLGVIGTRKSNQFGETVAGRIGRHFSDSGIPLCNGLADGIDICSVTLDDAFLAGVIGVMACGLDLLEDNLSSKRTMERAGKLLGAYGLLVSELPPGTEEDQNTVIASCRLQAGLSHVLLLVQSSRDGGSRFTVGHFCKLARKLAFVSPPEAQTAETQFEANCLLLQGEAGLAEFAGLKTAKTVKASMLPIRTRSDYDTVLAEFHGSRPSLL